MANTNQQVSDLEPTETMQVTQTVTDGMLEIEPATPPKKRASRPAKKPDLIEIDPEAIAAAQSSADLQRAVGESRISTSEPEPITQSVSTASVAPEPTVQNVVVNNTAPQASQGEVSRASAVMPNQRLINADFVQKTKAINSVPREVIEKRLDEIDAMFSLRRNAKGSSRDNATIMLALALWEIMGL